MDDLKNKAVVITGCSRGIGLAILKRFAANGANVIACCSHRTDERELMFAEIAKTNNVSVFPVYFDMSDEVSVKNGVKEIKALKQPISVLVNNAGISYMGLFAFTKISDAHHVFQVNYFSQLVMIQGLIGVLSKNGPASIINVASVAGIDGGVGVSIYGSTKASMILITKVLAQELASMNIRVNAVSPGIIETDMATQMGEKAIEATILSSSIKRIGKTDEVANTVLFLASKESSYINGQIIRVDGGIK
jgi:3-oxoacyl-[acyl-carrier protein] reductase